MTTSIAVVSFVLTFVFTLVREAAADRSVEGKAPRSQSPQPLVW